MPRKVVNVAHDGVFEAEPGSDVWSVKMILANGSRLIREVGSYKDADKAYEDHQAAKRLGIASHAEIMRGPKFSELVELAAAYYRSKDETKEKRFLGMATLMSLRFGNRIAATLTTMELENWLLDEADEHEWASYTKRPQVKFGGDLSRRHQP
ncbi:MAG: hypothetical protein ABSF70_10535 [Terracidiphilus sp.]|jgi:hypothetical protein